MKTRIELNNMEFFARHGCFSEEKIIGNRFVVNFWAEYDSSTAQISDEISDALNYQEIYNLIKEEMSIPSNLLEHVARRVVVKLEIRFPQIIDYTLRIEKINPPLGGKVESSSVLFKK